MNWGPQQGEALKLAEDWLRIQLNSSRRWITNDQVFYLAGFAGTGKTTMAMHLAALARSVCFAAFTGKAANVMGKKGCDGASTIHSLIYQPKEDEATGKTIFVRNPNSAATVCDLIVIDEVSMVGPELGADLLSFKKPVLVLGDPAQLPPVDGAGFFTSREPNFLLTEIHRQALENPIIRLSMDVREGRGLKLGDYGAARVIHREDVRQADVMAADQVLVGMNRTRQAYNRRMRAISNRDPEMPEVGDRLVCLRNNREKGLMNGSLWTLEQAEWRVHKGLPLGRGRKLPDRTSETDLEIVVKDPDDYHRTDARTRIEWFRGAKPPLEGKALFGYDQFDYGYALTVHKSQGSQWNNVYLFDESGGFRDNRQEWLYTGITRAADRITIVSGE